MKVNNSKIIAFITMISFVFIFNVAYAGNVWSEKTAITNATTEQVKKIDAGAIVLAKGQNNLPKKSGSKADC